MKDFMIKLVATDMDGTFLDGEGRFDMERLKTYLFPTRKRGFILQWLQVAVSCPWKSCFADVCDEVIL